MEIKYFEIPKICPVCGGETEIVISEAGVRTLICSNPVCEGKLVNRLIHFASKKGLDINGLSGRTLEKLIEWGWVESIPDLYNLSKKYRADWVHKTGFGVASVDRILKSIDNSAKNCDLAKFISALGIPLIGTRVAKQLAKEFGTWEKFINAVDDDDYKFYRLDGFGPEMDKALRNFNYQEADELATFFTFNAAAAPASNKKTLDGINVCITGKLKVFKNRAELQDAIEKAGGSVKSSITSKTNYLINNDTKSESSKNKAAKEKGIPIISEKDFIDKYLNL